MSNVHNGRKTTISWCTHLSFPNRRPFKLYAEFCRAPRPNWPQYHLPKLPPQSHTPPPHTDSHPRFAQYLRFKFKTYSDGLQADHPPNRVTE
ncbi:hypothetical protein Patl1_06507 [Pistacia atlantica]|uniref:Uncharacterized protein n=1 Tax=Pistacia atlantica TaxID=434234 RepID=A0ACC1BPK0_9ROSI|nr:hypothetical protein Patl1_06507 [Pistacia atlantica]